MPVRPPSVLYRTDYVRVTSIPIETPPEPIIKYKDRMVTEIKEKVIYKDDPKLLEQLNKALKENGELKHKLQALPKEHTQEESQEALQNITTKDHISELGLYRDIVFFDKVKDEFTIILLIFLFGTIIGSSICCLILR